MQAGTCKSSTSWNNSSELHIQMMWRIYESANARNKYSCSRGTTVRASQVNWTSGSRPTTCTTSTHSLCQTSEQTPVNLSSTNTTATEPIPSISLASFGQMRPTLEYQSVGGTTPTHVVYMIILPSSESFLEYALAGPVQSVGNPALALLPITSGLTVKHKVILGASISSNAHLFRCRAPNGI